MEQDQSQIPTWALLISNSEHGVADFTAWVEERKRSLMETATLTAQSMENVIGARLACGELDVLVGIVSWTGEEEQRYAALLGVENG